MIGGPLLLNLTFGLPEGLTGGLFMVGLVLRSDDAVDDVVREGKELEYVWGNTVLMRMAGVMRGTAGWHGSVEVGP